MHFVLLGKKDWDSRYCQPPVPSTHIKNNRPRKENWTQTNLVNHNMDTDDDHSILFTLVAWYFPSRMWQDKIPEKCRKQASLSTPPTPGQFILVGGKDGICSTIATSMRSLEKVAWVDDLLDYIVGSCWSSALDLCSGYWQVYLAWCIWSLGWHTLYTLCRLPGWPLCPCCRVLEWISRTYFMSSTGLVCAFTPRSVMCHFWSYLYGRYLFCALTMHPSPEL